MSTHGLIYISTMCNPKSVDVKCRCGLNVTLNFICKNHIQFAFSKTSHGTLDVEVEHQM